MQNEEKTIMYASDEAAQLKTVTGWVSSTGRFWGKDEHMARWDGSTHFICECGKTARKSYTKCDDCIAQKRREAYLKLPEQPYMGEPICLADGDEYFFSEDELIEYLEDNELEADEVSLLFCEPNYLPELDLDYFQDVMAEDAEYPDKLVSLVNEFNKSLKEINKTPISWFPGKIRVNYSK